MLNIARIVLVIIISSFHNFEAESLLHDTGNILLLIAIILVYIESIGIKNLELNKVKVKYIDDVSCYPPFWEIIFKYKKILISALLLATLFPLIIYKSRPYHRALMIKDVADSLRKCNLFQEAEMASKSAEKLLPKDEELRLNTARILLINGKYQQAIDHVSNFNFKTHSSINHASIIKAYALIGMEDFEKAQEIINLIPKDFRERDPLLAMVCAELSCQNNNPEMVTYYIQTAQRWALNQSRIRGLYPYLRSYHKLEAIYNTVTIDKYDNIVHASCAIEACFNFEDIWKGSAILTDAIKKRPQEPKLLFPLFYIILYNAEKANSFLA